MNTDTIHWIILFLDVLILLVLLIGPRWRS